MGVPYHKLLRCPIGGNFNLDLMKKLLEVGRASNNTLRVAIDEFRLCHESEFQIIERKDHWFGPPLNQDFLDDPHNNRVTVHGDGKQGKGIHPFSHLAAQWTTEKRLRTVQLQEKIDFESRNEYCDYVLVRYLHAQYDLDLKYCIHCDGAVKAYSLEDYEQSADGSFPTCQTIYYRKMFRVDGRIEIRDWVEIMAQWFRGNPLILEYCASL